MLGYGNQGEPMFFAYLFRGFCWMNWCVCNLPEDVPRFPAKHRQTSSNIIKHHQTSSTIINHHQPPSTIIKHLNIFFAEFPSAWCRWDCFENFCSALPGRAPWSKSHWKHANICTNCCSLASGSQWKGQRPLKFQNDSKCPEVFGTFLRKFYCLQSIKSNAVFFPYWILIPFTIGQSSLYLVSAWEFQLVFSWPSELPWLHADAEASLFKGVPLGQDPRATCSGTKPEKKNLRTNSQTFFVSVLWTAVSCWNGFQDILHSLHCYTVPLNSTVSADGANNCSFLDLDSINSLWPYMNNVRQPGMATWGCGSGLMCLSQPCGIWA